MGAAASGTLGTYSSELSEPSVLQSLLPSFTLDQLTQPEFAHWNWPLEPQVFCALAPATSSAGRRARRTFHISGRALSPDLRRLARARTRKLAGRGWRWGRGGGGRRRRRRRLRRRRSSNTEKRLAVARREKLKGQGTRKHSVFVRRLSKCTQIAFFYLRKP